MFPASPRGLLTVWAVCGMEGVIRRIREGEREKHPGTLLCSSSMRILMCKDFSLTLARV